MSTSERAYSFAVLPCLSVALFLTGCGGGFEAAKPSGNNEELVYRVNDGTAPFSNAPITVVPQEMPALPPGAQPFILEPPREPPKRVVEPDLDKAAVNLADGTVDLANVQISPYNRVGRLESRYSSDAPNTYRSCTAQLVGNTGVVLTAVHRVFNNKNREWARSIAFKLQYDQGTYTRQYDWECVAMVSGWPNGHYPFDYAMIKLRGVTPGGLGMTINVGAGHVDAVGYPAKYYNTERLVHVLGMKNASNP